MWATVGDLPRVLPNIEYRSHYHQAQELELLGAQAAHDGNTADAARYYTAAAEHLEAWIDNMHPGQVRTRRVITEAAAEMRRRAAAVGEDG